MKSTPEAPTRRPPFLEPRAVRFEDVPEILRVVGRAIALGCRDHYDAAQRAAVFASYASVLFVEALGPYEAVVAELEGRIAAYAQLDAATSRLRALFVDAECQGLGVGRALLADVEARAARRGCARLHGAMSLNAVAFYARAGFRALGGEERLMSASEGVHISVVRMEKRFRA